jgi:hypothetical protein
MWIFPVRWRMTLRFQHGCPNLAIARTGGETIRKKVLCFFLSRKKILLFRRKEAKDFLFPWTDLGMRIARLDRAEGASDDAI